MHSVWEGSHLCRGFSPACRAARAAPSSPPSLTISLSLSLSVVQLSQTGASLDNRVPTPASAASADLHSQHVGAELPAQEVKAETHHEQQEFEAAGGKTEPKMEVGGAAVSTIYLFVHSPAVGRSSLTLLVRKWREKKRVICVCRRRKTPLRRW